MNYFETYEEISSGMNEENIFMDKEHSDYMLTLSPDSKRIYDQYEEFNNIMESSDWKSDTEEHKARTVIDPKDYHHSGKLYMDKERGDYILTLSPDSKRIYEQYGSILVNKTNPHEEFNTLIDSTSNTSGPNGTEGSVLMQEAFAYYPKFDEIFLNTPEHPVIKISNINVPKIKCPECGFKTYNNKILNDHKARMHTVIDPKDYHHSRKVYIDKEHGGYIVTLTHDSKTIYDQCGSILENETNPHNEFNNIIESTSNASGQSRTEGRMFMQEAFDNCQNSNEIFLNSPEHPADKIYKQCHAETLPAACSYTIKKIVGKLETPIKCSECDFETYYNAALNRHKATQHAIMGPNVYYMCSKCKKGFKKKSYLIDVHEKACGLSNSQKKCEYCEYTGNSLSALSQHKRKVHYKICSYNYVCSVCNKKFKYKIWFDKHMKRNHST